MVALAAGCTLKGSARAENFPLHNPDIGLDVDGNRLVDARDVDLIIAFLVRTAPTVPVELVAQASLPPTYYYNTSNDQTISARDAGLVIQSVLHAPEPGAFVLAGLAIVGFTVYAWGRRRRWSSST